MGKGDMLPLVILYENDEWRPALESVLAQAGLGYSFWNLAAQRPDMIAAPPEAVFWSRMSASAPSRGHGRALEVAADVLKWLESHRRRVINGARALEIEVSKMAQYDALGECGIETPRTLAARDRAGLSAAAAQFAGAPFIVKPDCGGKGQGVRRFAGRDELAAWVDGPDGPSAGERWLVQEYLESRDQTITRAEFVGGRLLYAVEVDASSGFELCPADGCDVGGTPGAPGVRDRFRIQEGKAPALRGDYERFLHRNGIDIAGIEYIECANGRTVTYDVNVNTNYNRRAESRAGCPDAGMKGVVAFLTACADPSPCAKTGEGATN